jgi:uncharacterized protein (TIGR00251 family)
MVILEEIIKKHQDGAILNIFVTPESHRIVFPAGINEWRKCIEIKVKSPAFDNRANKDIIKIIANFFKKPVKEVSILKGEKKPNKIVFIKKITVSFILERLRESINGI